MPKETAKEFYLCVCAMFRDEARYLEEWANFHLNNGVDHLFLYDNASSDGSTEILAPFVEDGRATIMNWPTPWSKGAQRKAYQHCLAEYGGRCRWLAFIDVDEFIFSPEGPLDRILPEYEAYPGIVVHWQCYGSSGHRTMPPGEVTRNYVYRAKTDWIRNRRVKSIVDPSRTLRPDGSHYFVFRNRERAVNENKEEIHRESSTKIKRALGKILSRFWPEVPIDPYTVQGHRPNSVCASRLRINHYITRSYEEFGDKQNRWKEAKNFKYGKSDFFRYHDRNEILDPLITKHD